MNFKYQICYFFDLENKLNNNIESVYLQDPITKAIRRVNIVYTKKKADNVSVNYVKSNLDKIRIAIPCDKETYEELKDGNDCGFVDLDTMVFGKPFLYTLIFKYYTLHPQFYDNELFDHSLRIEKFTGEEEIKCFLKPQEVVEYDFNGEYKYFIIFKMDIQSTKRISCNTIYHNIIDMDSFEKKILERDREENKSGAMY